MKLERSSLLLLLLGGIILTSCDTTEPPPAFTSKAPFSSLKAHRKLPPALVPIFQLLKEGKYADASRLINASLQNEHQNAVLHILNALTYEKLAEQGTSSGTNLAAIGYQNAINLDPTNLFAIVGLAKLNYREKKFAEAQEGFANALLIKPNNPELLQELAAASYYAYDLKTAFSAIEQAKKLKPNDPLINRSAAMIYAALGDSKAAHTYFGNFKKKAGEDPAVSHVASRLEDWNAFYKSGKMKLAAATTEEHDEPSEDAITTQEVLEEEIKKEVETHVPGTQIIMDCYLLRITETTQTTKGQNLFDGLAVTLTPGGFTAFNALVKGSAAPLTQASTGGTPTSSQGFKANQAQGFGAAPAFTSGTFSPSLNSAGSISGRIFSLGLTWAGLTYNLNIANAVENRTELVSRPSLMTFLKKQSTFFSGQELATGLTGQYGGTLVKYPIGVTLIITPTSIKGDLLNLDISIESSILGSTNSNLFNSTVTVYKSRVNTVAKVRIGETLMLSGIYERSENYSKSGFPGLDNIPVMQYFFSQEQTESAHTSVVYLVTPRSPDLVKNAISRAMIRNGHPENLRELMSRTPDWFNPGPNLVPVFSHFSRDPSVYYEFRTGDLIPPSWGWEPTIESKLSMLENFLYF